MSFLVIDNERFALQIGDNTLGGTGDDAIPAEALRALRPCAVITVLPGTPATIRRLPAGPSLTLDGAAVDGSPRELRHGCRLVVAGVRIGYGELALAGRTANPPAKNGKSGHSSDLPALQQSEPTADTGGRLTDLRSGTVYAIPAEGLRIGRDPGCDVVIAAAEVSRDHVFIAPSLLGYMLTDRSDNGVLVSGSRVHGSQLLSQRDVIRIGDDEFRFEADPTTLEPNVSRPELQAVFATPAPARGLEAPTRDRAPYQPPTAEIPPAKPLLASLEVLNAGPMKGMRFRIERAAVQIGRGAHNDVALPDESVSGSHATLVQTGATWRLQDLGSRNGTYLDGKRLEKGRDIEIRGPAELRFGNIKVLFRPISRATHSVKATRRIV